MFDEFAKMLETRFLSTLKNHLMQQTTTTLHQSMMVDKI